LVAHLINAAGGTYCAKILVALVGFVGHDWKISATLAFRLRSTVFRHHDYLKIGTILGIAAIFAGCSSNEERSVAWDLPAPELIMPSNELLDIGHNADFTAGAWAEGRNDDRLGGMPGRDGVILDLAEIRHREYLWTSHGRPHEHSTTYTRTIERRIGK
jgi:hypothetical protein